MEYQRLPGEEKTSPLSFINFILGLVIMFCLNYLYIDFLFR